jgi:hypothetical protein
VRGLVQIFINNLDPIAKKQAKYRPYAYVSGILPSTIHVALPLSNMLANRSANTPASDFHYTVTLAYGARFEPWVANIE